MLSHKRERNQLNARSVRHPSPRTLFRFKNRIFDLKPFIPYSIIIESGFLESVFSVEGFGIASFEVYIENAGLSVEKTRKPVNNYR